MLLALLLLLRMAVSKGLLVVCADDFCLDHVFRCCLSWDQGKFVWKNSGFVDSGKHCCVLVIDCRRVLVLFNKVCWVSANVANSQLISAVQCC